jgi:S-methylmethionine-dependent homocysteine/selenocysteine methylase
MMPDGSRLRERIERGAPVLLDGALGTELEREGIRSQLPLWTTHALLESPRTVEAIHRRYAQAGAEVLTAATFRTQRRTLARADLAERAAELTRSAVELAFRAAGSLARTPWVAGSAPPLEDCYRPDRVPAPDDAEREHAEHAENLARAGVDLVLIETMNSAREAAAAARAARACGLPFLVSWVCGDDGRLLSGESLPSAIEALAECEPLALLVNCLPPSAVTRCLPALRGSGRPFGVYANLGEPTSSDARRSEECTPEEFAAHAEAWVAAGARLIGGCCGTRPAHIAALAARFNPAELDELEPAADPPFARTSRAGDAES